VSFALFRMIIPNKCVFKQLPLVSDTPLKSCLRSRVEQPALTKRGAPTKKPKREHRVIPPPPAPPLMLNSSACRSSPREW